MTEMPPLTFAALQEMVKAYLETVPDDSSDEWDYKEERLLTYRESAQETLDGFLSWLKREYDDQKRD